MDLGDARLGVKQEMSSDRRTDWTRRRRAAPHHLAIIMDGNRRWAAAHGLSTHDGHRAGARNLRSIAMGCADAGIKCLTVFAFSTENWRRPSIEVNLLFGLMRETLFSELDELDQRGARLRLIGNKNRLPPDLQELVAHAEERTSGNSELALNIALNYGGRWDIVQAARALSSAIQAGEIELRDIDEHTFSGFLELGDLPAPDLCIRTGGEFRLSNFMLWDLAYSELYFSRRFWPEFTVEDLHNALESYGSRQRRFGAGGSRSSVRVGASS